MAHYDCTKCGEPMGISPDRCPKCKSEGVEPGGKPSALDVQEGGGHYKDRGIQPIEFIVSNNLGWCEGNVIKYVVRHGDKGGAADIKKAIHYLQLLLELEYPDET